MHKQFVFSVAMRATPIALVILNGLAILMVYVASLIFPGKWTEALPYCALLLSISAGVVVIDLIRNHKFYQAVYIMDSDSITYQVGPKVSIISYKEAFYISILDLYESSGRSYGGNRKYTVLWKNVPPRECIHPFTLMKKEDCFVFPCTREVEISILNWCSATSPNIPCYPKTLYHTGQV